MTLKKDTHVDRELTFADFYGIESSEKALQENKGKVMQMKGYFTGQMTKVTHRNITMHGKYRAWLRVSPVGGMSVACYFNDSVGIPNIMKECTVKGSFISQGSCGLKNCIVVE